MDDAVARITRAVEALRDVPGDLRPLAFQYLLRWLEEDEATRAHRTSRRESGLRRAPRAGSRGRPRRSADELKVSVAELKQLASEKAPQNHEERYAVIAFCLARDGIARLGDDEILECYRTLRWHPPANVGQILCNAHTRKRWFTRRGDDGKRELTDAGKHFVEHELPRQG